MKLPRLRLGPRLSGVSWFFIELFTLAGLFLLPFSKSGAEIGFVTALCIWILRKFPWNEPFPSIRPCNASYLVFFAFVLLSLWRVPGTEMAIGLRGVLKWLEYLGVFFMLFDYARDAKRLPRLVAAFVASTALVCVDGFYQMIVGQDLVKHYTADLPGRAARMRGSFGSPNGLAAQLIAALPVAFWLFWKRGRWDARALFFAALLALMVVSLALTLSRSAMLALVLASTFYLVRHGGLRVLAPATVLLGVFFAFSPLARENFIFSLNLGDITVGERLRFWRVTWDMIREHPFLGYGINMYFRRFAELAPAAEAYRGYAHNCYLQMWSEIGIFGLLAFLYPFVILVGEEFLRRPSEGFGLRQALSLALMASLVQSFFDTNFYALQSALLFWVLWGAFAGEGRPPETLDKAPRGVYPYGTG